MPPRPPAPKVHGFDSLQEGQSARIEFTVSEDDMAAFAALSGDYNPLHCDAAFAASRGFGGRVVYGALLLAKLSRLIGMDLPGRDSVWHGVEMQFSKPLLVGRPAVLEASVTHLSAATRSLQMRLRIESEGTVIARGKASVSVRDAG